MKYYLSILLLTLGSTLSLLSIGVPVVSAQEIAAAKDDRLQDIQQIATGYSHACALTTPGGVKCWGNNDYGQVGDGGTWKTTPSAVVAGLDYVVHLPVILH